MLYSFRNLNNLVEWWCNRKLVLCPDPNDAKIFIGYREKYKGELSAIVNHSQFEKYYQLYKIGNFKFLERIFNGKNYATILNEFGNGKLSTANIDLKKENFRLCRLLIFRYEVERKLNTTNFLVEKKIGYPQQRNGQSEITPPSDDSKLKDFIIEDRINEFLDIEKKLVENKILVEKKWDYRVQPYRCLASLIFILRKKSILIPIMKGKNKSDSVKAQRRFFASRYGLNASASQQMKPSRYKVSMFNIDKFQLISIINGSETIQITQKDIEGL